MMTVGLLFAFLVSFVAGAGAHGGEEDTHGEEVDLATECAVGERSYNKKLRIGTIFIVLFTSSICKIPHYGPSDTFY